MIKKKKILIIIPAYNEERNIKKIVDEIKLLKEKSLSVLIVDDGSRDGTYVESKKTKAFVVSHPFNLGIGGAVQTGFKFAREKNFDIAVQVDGDGQHDVQYLQKLILPILNDEVDISIGSRFLPPYLGYQSSFIRRVGIIFFSKLIGLVTRYIVTDPTSGFRAYNKKMIKIFADYYPQDFPEPEAILVASRHQARIQEVPVQMRERLTGSSSIRYLKTFYYMVKVTFAIILDKLKRQKV